MSTDQLSETVQGMTLYLDHAAREIKESSKRIKKLEENMYIIQQRLLTIVAQGPK